MPKKINLISFNEKVKFLYGDDYTIISDKLNAISDKIEIRHNICGNNFDIVANEFTRTSNQKLFKQTCLKCRKKGFSEIKILQRVNEFTNNKIGVIKLGTNLHSHSTIFCKVCNHTWNASLHTLFQNLKTNVTDSFGCPICSKKKLTEEIFLLKVKERFSNQLKITSSYINQKTEVNVFCNRCENYFLSKPSNLLNSSQCKICLQILRQSKGSQYICNILDSLNLTYEKEVKFDECIYKKELPFDFVVFVNDDYFIIEYDGEHHYRGWNGNKDSLEQIMIRDKIKDDFCTKYNIPILRINFNLKKFEIEELIMKFFAPIL